MSEPVNDILVQISKGNEKTFEALFRTHYAALCGYAKKYLLELEQAEEIVQDLFYNLWNKREALEIQTSIEAYLFRSVRNACLNAIKHQKVRENYAAQAQASNNPGGHENRNPVEALELQEKIDQAINALPPERKKIFLLSRFEGKKYREIADELGLSVKTVEAQMGSALKFLRENLSDFLMLYMVILMEIYIMYLLL